MQRQKKKKKKKKKKLLFFSLNIFIFVTSILDVKGTACATLRSAEWQSTTAAQQRIANNAIVDKYKYNDHIVAWKHH
jgi:hypothetical protein